MKEGVRLLGIDDAAFELEDDQAKLSGVVYRGTEFIEDIRFEKVDVDGYDATEKVIRLFEKCNNPKQIKAVILDGISFAGFNIVDIYEVAERIGKPVIAVTSNEPDPEVFQKIMDKTGNKDERFEKFDPHTEIDLKDGEVYVQFAGTDLEEAEQIVNLSIINGLTPEPIRVAHMIGQGLRDV
jgi:endonuclease V-like protein UPF0215 family